jgi:hypothetical protein
VQRAQGCGEWDRIEYKEVKNPMKKFFCLALLLCLAAGTRVFAEKKEGIVWVEWDTHVDEMYIAYSNLDGSVRRTSNSAYPTYLLQAIGYEPGAYFVLEKSNVMLFDKATGQIYRDQNRAVVDVMHYDGETCTPCIEDMELNNAFQYIAYFDDFLYYIKRERIDGERLYFLMRTKQGMFPDVVTELQGKYSTDHPPIISERGEIVYTYYDKEKGSRVVACVTSSGAEIVADGADALWMDSDNILYTSDEILYLYSLKTRESNVFLDVSGRPIQMPGFYGAITINRAKDTLAVLVPIPNEECPDGYTEFGLCRPYIVSLITGEHRRVEEADISGDPYLAAWWGE